MKTYNFVALLACLLIFNANAAEPPLETAPGTIAEVVPQADPEPVTGVAPRDEIDTEPGTITGTTPQVDPEPINGAAPRDVIDTEPGTITGVVPQAQPQPVILLSPSTLGSNSAGKTIEIIWPASMQSHVLEMTDDLSRGQWTPVNQTPATANGKKRLLLPAGSEKCFFRLR
jgi:hypothetical protein